MGGRETLEETKFPGSVKRIDPVGPDLTESDGQDDWGGGQDPSRQVRVVRVRMSTAMVRTGAMTYVKPEVSSWSRYVGVPNSYPNSWSVGPNLRVQAPKCSLSPRETELNGYKFYPFYSY